MILSPKMKQAKKRASSRRTDGIFAGYQWGEIPHGEKSFPLKQSNDSIEIIAAMPRYSSEDRSTDLIYQYELAREARRSTKGFLKAAPHIRFANADSDNDLIEFVRSFGPVVAATWINLLPHRLVEIPDREGRSYIEQPMRAEQNMVELRNEQHIYKAAMKLVLELSRRDEEYDLVEAAANISEIAHLIRSWPLQWRRERKARGKALLWKVRPGTIERINAMAIRNPRELLPPQVDVRIVLSELLNVFPAFVFPNPLEMHAYLHYGIRPLLYSLLRREFLHPHVTAVCANTMCRKFFEVDRTGQQHCSPICSRQQRQRDYWQQRGKIRREKRKSADASI